MIRLLVTLCLMLFLSGLAGQGQEPRPEYYFSIYFGGGSYYIDTEQRQELHNFIMDIPRLEEYEVELHGHTDNIGSQEYNQWLSEQRNQAVFQRLLQEQIPPATIDIKDFGERAPVFDNSTLDGKLRNRRVDIIFKRVNS